MPDESPHPEPTTTRAVYLMLVAVIGLAFVGFLVGIRQGTPVPEFGEREAIAAKEFADAVPAASYVAFDRRVHGPNAEWSSSLPGLPQPAVEYPADETFETRQVSVAERRAVLAARADRRAFHGAPPVVPHPIDQMTAASCTACHADGIVIGRGVQAPRMSHEFLPNCTQCHVEQRQLDLRSFIFEQNSFDGLDAPFGGRRAWDGAPPTVPHSIFMRENCLSCHGPTGPEPIRTTHPWRTNCLQCHAPSAVLDQTVREDRPSLLSELDEE